MTSQCHKPSQGDHSQLVICSPSPLSHSHKHWCLLETSNVPVLTSLLAYPARLIFNINRLAPHRLYVPCAVVVEPRATSKTGARSNPGALRPGPNGHGDWGQPRLDTNSNSHISSIPAHPAYIERVKLRFYGRFQHGSIGTCTPHSP